MQAGVILPHIRFPCIYHDYLNPSNAETTFVQSTRTQDSWKTIETLGIHLKALAEYSQMSTHLPGFQYFFVFFASFCIGQISYQQDKG